MLDYCYDNDGYSMQQMDNYHSVQMQDDYHHSPHAGMSMKPPSPPQYSKPNTMMYNGNYTSHQDGFPGKNNNYSNAYYGQSVHQSGYSGSSGGTNGYYMSHAVMGGKPPYHDTMNASHFTQGGGGGGGYNSMMMSSRSDHQYDYNYNNKIRRPPNRMQGAVMGYDDGNWGNPTAGYNHYNHQIVNCMPYGYNSNDEWIRKSLA